MKAGVDYVGVSAGAMIFNNKAACRFWENDSGNSQLTLVSGLSSMRHFLISTNPGYMTALE